jgi:dTDP-4-dehydrorhamnose 3,5-epimerase-like enzyme
LTGELLGGHARLLSLAPQFDSRGCLIPFEFSTLPFVPKRAFIIQDVPIGTVRGGHAHKTERQLLVRLKGRASIRLVFQTETSTVILGSLAEALLIEPGVWSEQQYLEPDTRLLVFASESYDPSDYRDAPA